MVSSDYINTIPPEQEPWFPGDEHVERRIRAFIRWNAMAMVTRANRRFDGLGGHLSTYASSASLYEVGFNHFFRGKSDGGFGDQIFIQGHAAPGVYARAFLEGRLTEDQLDHFRREVGGHGLPSYPHPRRMPDFWEFPTVSMGLGPLNAVYQARFNRYLLNRQIADTSRAKVWCFVGDGEMDEPESMAGLHLAATEQLDNLIFVVNCNLQRLDGPVRGNGKIIQELEATYRGGGWNVIKVIWGREWDDLLLRDADGVLVNQMNTTCDGQFQKYVVESGEYIREHFFGPDPRLRKMVEHLSDDDLRKLPRGGHDYHKLYAAYKAAIEHEGSPTVILAKTVKGWTLGPEFEARNATHQIKKMTEAELRTFRDRLFLDIPDKVLDEGEPPYYHPGEKSEELAYMRSRRQALDGPIPERVVRSEPLPAPAGDPYKELWRGRATRSRRRPPRRSPGCCATWSRTRPSASGSCPSSPTRVAPSASTPSSRPGQDLRPLRAEVRARRRPAPPGLQGGAHRPDPRGGHHRGRLHSHLHRRGHRLRHLGRADDPLLHLLLDVRLPAGGDLIWAFGDARGRGFLLGATAGRTTLHGEGLQHADGHSPVLASTVPNCRVYDPAFAYELAAIIEDGITAHVRRQPGGLLLLRHPVQRERSPCRPCPRASGRASCGGSTATSRPRRVSHHRARILACGTAMGAALEARALLGEHHDMAAEVWSATSYKSLREDALAMERWNRLHPDRGAPGPGSSGPGMPTAARRSP